MPNRLRLLQATTALLYLGPLLAGLMGQGWPAIALFSAIFVVWSVILRPHLWPATVSDLTRTDAIVPLAALIVTQVLLVVLCFAFGRGMGGVMGLRLALPASLPAVISFLSVPLSRLVWNPQTDQTLMGFDPLLHKPGHPEPRLSDPQHTPDVSERQLSERLLAEVMALPDDIGEADLQAHITAISTHIDAMQIRHTLQDAAENHQITRAGIKALIVHATDPDVAGLLSGSAYPSRAFTLAGDDDDLMILFATRCARVVEDDPLLASDCPDSTALASAALRADPLAHDALMRLAGLLRQSQMAAIPSVS